MSQIKGQFIEADTIDASNLKPAVRTSISDAQGAADAALSAATDASAAADSAASAAAAAQASADAKVASVNGETGTVVLDTGDIAESEPIEGDPAVQASGDIEFSGLAADGDTVTILIPSYSGTPIVLTFREEPGSYTSGLSTDVDVGGSTTNQRNAIIAALNAIAAWDSNLSDYITYVAIGAPVRVAVTAGVALEGAAGNEIEITDTGANIVTPGTLSNGVDATSTPSIMYFTESRARSAAILTGALSGAEVSKAPTHNAVVAALAGKAPSSHTHASTDITSFDSAVRAAAVEDAIVDGVTNKAPSQNAVFDALAAISTPTWFKESITLDAGDIVAQSVTLAHTPVANSLTLSVSTAMQTEGRDYSIAGDVLSFEGGLATGGASPLIATNVLDLQYQY